MVTISSSVGAERFRRVACQPSRVRYNTVDSHGRLCDVVIAPPDCRGAVLAGCTKIRWVPNVLVFWFAFVLTRPLGATVGDFFTKPAVQGGLGLGTYGASAVLLAILAGLMTHSTIRQHRQTTGVTQA
jgi:repeat uncharacterized protein DUF347